MSERRSEMLLGVVLPLVLVAVILFADQLEGPKTAYVGVLAVVLLAAAAGLQKFRTVKGARRTPAGK